MALKLSAPEALAQHWPEYLIEAWALGMFMVAAGVATTMFEYPGSALHLAVASAGLRRVLIGILMGATAVALIYSAWGRRSGAHMNPAVTLAFFSLGRVAAWDAVFYICAQCLGGLLGVLAVLLALGDKFARPPVNYVATLPGPAGVGVAFAAEACIAFGLMLAVLISSSHARTARYTGLVAGSLVAAYIALEAPLSGMSMNPARSIASALPGGLWQSIWVYLSAPILGMWLATRVHRLLFAQQARGCAKLHHSLDVPCIHCGHSP